MDKKKLIGTIVGVVFFVALIAGATFAWLTFALNVTNNVVGSGTMNFAVSYSNGGGQIEDAPILSAGTPDDASVVTITANKYAGSAPGNLILYLNTTGGNDDEGKPWTDAELLASQAINYAVCIDECDSFDDITTKGVVTATGQLPILPASELQDAPTNYNVYFWLDGTKITEAHIDKRYTGYISAEAVQVDTR